MAIIIIKGAVTIEWDNVPHEVLEAIETLLYQIEENQELDMVSHVE
jgi:chorismate mutase